MVGSEGDEGQHILAGIDVEELRSSRVPDRNTSILPKVHGAGGGPIGVDGNVANETAGWIFVRSAVTQVAVS
jgi:hypothetical protein